jgi:hypothetical protein
MAQRTNRDAKFNGTSKWPTEEEEKKEHRTGERERVVG